MYEPTRGWKVPDLSLNIDSQQAFERPPFVRPPNSTRACTASSSELFTQTADCRFRLPVGQSVVVENSAPRPGSAGRDLLYYYHYYYYD